MGEDVGLSGARAGDNEQGRARPVPRNSARRPATARIYARSPTDFVSGWQRNSPICNPSDLRSNSLKGVPTAQNCPLKSIGVFGCHLSEKPLKNLAKASDFQAEYEGSIPFSPAPTSYACETRASAISAVCRRRFQRRSRKAKHLRAFPSVPGVPYEAFLVAPCHMLGT